MSLDLSDQKNNGKICLEGVAFSMKRVWLYGRSSAVVAEERVRAELQDLYGDDIDPDALLSSLRSEYDKELELSASANGTPFAALIKYAKEHDYQIVGLSFDLSSWEYPDRVGLKTAAEAVLSHAADAILMRSISEIARDARFVHEFESCLGGMHTVITLLQDNTDIAILAAMTDPNPEPPVGSEEDAE